MCLATSEGSASLEQAVAFEGETGPYVQYTHARACSVLRKAGLLSGHESTREWVTTPLTGDKRIQPLEELDSLSYELMKTISYFPEVRKRAINEADPSLVAKHILDVSQDFNRFYHEMPILNAAPTEREFRLRLTDATRLTIRAALEILGIEHPVEI